MARPPPLARKACRKQRVPQQRKQPPARTGFDFSQITKPPARIAKAFDFSQHNKAFDCSKITKPPAVPRKAAQGITNKGLQPLARKAAQGITKAQKAAQPEGTTRLQPGACQAPHAMQSASPQDWQISSRTLARKRRAEAQPSQPLARKSPRKSPGVDAWEMRRVFDSSVSEAEHLQ